MLGMFVCTFYTYEFGNSFHVVNGISGKVFICQSDAGNVCVLFQELVKLSDIFEVVVRDWNKENKTLSTDKMRLRLINV